MTMTTTERLELLCQPRDGALPKIGLDTNCVQYYISDPPVEPWADCLDSVFQAGLGGKAELYVSTVVVSELLAHVHFAHRDRGYDPELDLLSILRRHFQVLDVCGDVANMAGRLRGNYVPGQKITLATPDAMIGATSLHHSHTIFVTNDAKLADALPTDNCFYLRDIALEWLGHEFPAKCLNGTGTVKPSNRGAKLPSELSIATLEIGSIKPDPRTSWKRILSDGFNVASVLNEPCVMFVLTQRNGPKIDTVEVIFSHDGLKGREPDQILKMLKSHLELRFDERKNRYVAKPGKAIRAFCFTSMERERARQSQPGFESKSDHKKNADAWNGYLSILRRFKFALSMPQTTWLLCENGVARELRRVETLRFLDKAENVLGWEGWK